MSTGKSENRISALDGKDTVIRVPDRTRLAFVRAPTDTEPNNPLLIIGVIVA